MLEEALDGLDRETRARIDADFERVDTMACEQGIQVMLTEGRHFHDLDLEPLFEPLPGFHDKALLAFLDYPRVAEIAELFVRTDALPGNYWIDRGDQVPLVTPRDDPESCRALAEEVGLYFKTQEGRGGDCQVEVYKRDQDVYFFCYTEDYGATAVEFETEGLVRRAHRPAFEVVFVYKPEAGMIRTFYQGPKKTRQALEGIFGRVILGTELAPSQDRVYELNPLRRRDFHFSYPADSGIGAVRIQELRLTIMGREQRLTLSVPSERPQEIHDLLDELFNTPQRPGTPGAKIDLAQTKVTRAKLRVVFPLLGAKPKSRSFYVTFPNACTLKPDGLDRVIHQMLVDSGLEKPPAPPEV